MSVKKETRSSSDCRVAQDWSMFLKFEKETESDTGDYGSLLLLVAEEKGDSFWYSCVQGLQEIFCPVLLPSPPFSCSVPLPCSLSHCVYLFRHWESIFWLLIFFSIEHLSHIVKYEYLKLMSYLAWMWIFINNIYTLYLWIKYKLMSAIPSATIQPRPRFGFLRAT